MNAQFSRSDLKLRAKSKVANVRGDSVVVTLVYIIIIGAVNGIGGALTAVNLNAGVFVNIIGMGASLLAGTGLYLRLCFILPQHRYRCATEY